jgi:hypothetical protein
VLEGLQNDTRKEINIVVVNGEWEERSAAGDSQQRVTESRNSLTELKCFAFLKNLGAAISIRSNS